MSNLLYPQNTCNHSIFTSEIFCITILNAILNAIAYRTSCQWQQQCAEETYVRYRMLVYVVQNWIIVQV